MAAAKHIYAATRPVRDLAPHSISKPAHNLYRNIARSLPFSPQSHLKAIAIDSGDAPGEARGYLVKGRMIDSFAIIAYPARYGVSGVMSVTINQHGLLYKADLAKDTNEIASTIPMTMTGGSRYAHRNV